MFSSDNRKGKENPERQKAAAPVDPFPEDGTPEPPGESCQNGGMEEPRNDGQGLLEELESAREMLKRLNEENRILSESIARARADFFNYRQRVERENERLRATASESAVAALIPVLDNLDRALSSNRNEEDPFYRGVEMVRGQFFSVLESMGVSVIETVGSPFDPAVHEAVATVEAGEDIEDGIVTDEIQAGYKVAGKVIRAACVKVARAGS
jgi:molecular chaperone GrpE (heat shock protein)